MDGSVDENFFDDFNLIGIDKDSESVFNSISSFLISSLLSSSSDSSDSSNSFPRLNTWLFLQNGNAKLKKSSVASETDNLLLTATGSTLFWIINKEGVVALKTPFWVASINFWNFAK